MKSLYSLPGLCALYQHQYTSRDSNVRTRGNDTIYFFSPPPLTLTPRVCVITFPCVLSMWCRSDSATIIAPHYSQLTRFLFLSLNMDTSPSSHCFYAASTCYPQINTEVYTITFVFPGSFIFWLYQTCAQAPSVYFSPIWGINPRCGRRLHRTQCCVRPLPKPTPSVPLIKVKL